MLPTSSSNETTFATLPLPEQRRLLRAELHAQRAVIAEQLDPTYEVRGNQNAYPRSMTMRYLTEHSGLVGGVFTGVASLLVGARYFKTITGALAAFNLVRTAMANRRG
jgi:hypothetical protein